MRLKGGRVPKKTRIGYTKGKAQREWLDTVDRDAERMLKRKIWRMSAGDKRCMEPKD